MKTEQPDGSDTLLEKEQVSQWENERNDNESSREMNINEPSKKGLDVITEKGADNQLTLQIGKHVFTATLVNNSSTEALKNMLKDGPITIDMQDYGNMEKVSTLSTNLPRNDQQITTEPGDLILYQGNAFVIYYAPNTWNFTRLGKINDVKEKEFKEALGKGDVKVTLSLDE